MSPEQVGYVFEGVLYAIDLRKYLSHKLGDYLATLETILHVVDDDEATAVDLEYSRQLLWDADHCLRDFSTTPKQALLNARNPRSKRIKGV